MSGCYRKPVGKIRNFALPVIFLLLVLLAFSSCNDMFSPIENGTENSSFTPVASEASPKAVVYSGVCRFPGSAPKSMTDGFTPGGGNDSGDAKSIAPDFSGGADSMDVMATGAGGTIPGTVTKEGDVFYFTITLVPGTWTLEAAGSNASGELIFTGSKTVVVVEGEFPDLDLVLKPVSTGTGSVDFSVSYPAGRFTKASYSMQGAGSYSDSVNLGAADSSFAITKNDVPCGTYSVEIKFFDENGIAYAISDSASVYKNFTTSKWDSAGGALPVSAGACVLAESDITLFAGSVVYVDAAAGDDDAGGSYYGPLKTLSKAVAKIIKINDGSRQYRIYLKGTFSKADDCVYIFNNSGPALDLSIESYDGGNAVLDGTNLENQKIAVYVGGSVANNLVLKSVTVKNAAYGISCGKSTVTLKGNSSIESNRAGIYVQEGTINLEDSATIHDNVSSENSKAAVFAYKSTINVSSGSACSVYGNEALSGGGMYLDSSTLNVSADFTIDGNTSTGNAAGSNFGGGGLYLINSEINVDSGCRLTVSNNESKWCGGGIYIADCNAKTYSRIDITGNKCLDNGTNGMGGGIYVTKNTIASSITMEDCHIDGNRGSFGGGACVDANCSFNIGDGFVLSGNTAVSNGNGINNGGILAISGGAKISSDNDVYLLSGKNIMITGNLTADAPVAMIKHQSPAVGVQVVSESAAPLLKNNFGKFAYDGDFGIGEDGKLVLALYVDGSAAVSGNGSYTSPFNSFRAAVISPGLFNGFTIYVAGTCNEVLSSSINVTKDITVTQWAGKDAAVIKSPSNRSGDFIKIESTSQEVLFKDVVIDGNNVSAGGSGINNAGKLTLEGTTIRNCKNSSNGGGIYNSGELILTDSGIYSCSARDGGGFYSTGNVTLQGTTCIGASGKVNTAQCGGGFYFNSSASTNKVILKDSAQVSYNTATSRAGGGCYMYSGNLECGDSAAFEYNTSKSDGSGVYVVNGTFKMTGGTVRYNKTQNSGDDMAAVFVSMGTMEMTGGEITSNTGTGSSSKYDIGYIGGSPLKMGGDACIGKLYLTASGSFGALKITLTGNITNNPCATVTYGGTDIDSQPQVLMANSYVAGNYDKFVCGNDGYYIDTSGKIQKKSAPKVGSEDDFALALYYAPASGTTIDVTGDMTLSSQYDITGKVEILADTADVTITKAVANAPLFKVSGTAELLMGGGANALTFDGDGYHGDTWDDSKLNKCVELSSGTVTLKENCNFTHFRNDGGLFMMSGGTLNIEGAVFTKNKCDGQQKGNAINMSGGVLNFSSGEISDNEGGYGAIYVETNAECNLSGTALIKANLGRYGGGILCRGKLVMTGGTFEANRAWGSKTNMLWGGGGLYTATTSAHVELTGGTFKENYTLSTGATGAKTPGGGIHATNGYISISSAVVFDGNYVKGVDGVIQTTGYGSQYYIDSGVNFVLNGSTITALPYIKD